MGEGWCSVCPGQVRSGQQRAIVMAASANEVSRQRLYKDVCCRCAASDT